MDEDRRDGPSPAASEDDETERRTRSDRRGGSDRRSNPDRRSSEDRRGSGLRQPPSGKPRPYFFRSLIDRREEADRRHSVDRRAPFDRRLGYGEPVVELTPEELQALLTPSEE